MMQQSALAAHALCKKVWSVCGIAGCLLLCACSGAQPASSPARGGDGLVKPEVNLMLARGDLVMGRLDFKAHFLQGQDDLAPDILSLAQRFKVEIGSRIIGLRSRITLVIGIE